MAREKKSIVVDKVSDNTGREIEILYNPNIDRHYHHAEYAGENFKDVDPGAVRKWARQRLADTAHIDWKPIIIVGMRKNGFDIDVERQYIGLPAGSKKYRTSKWDVSSELRLPRSGVEHDLPIDAELPYKYSPNHWNITRFYLVYSEQVYVTLTELQRRLTDLNEELGNALIDDDLAHLSPSMLNLWAKTIT